MEDHLGKYRNVALETEVFPDTETFLQTDYFL